MKITIEFTESDLSNTRMSIFINGVNSGSLYMKSKEASSFHQIVANGCAHFDEFVSYGKIAKNKEK